MYEHLSCLLRFLDVAGLLKMRLTCREIKAASNIILADVKLHLSNLLWFEEARSWTLYEMYNDHNHRSHENAVITIFKLQTVDNTKIELNTRTLWFGKNTVLVYILGFDTFFDDVTAVYHNCHLGIRAPGDCCLQCACAEKTDYSITKIVRVKYTADLVNSALFKKYRAYLIAAEFSSH